MDENTIYKNEDHPLELMTAVLRDMQANKTFPEGFEVDFNTESGIYVGYGFEILYLTESDVKPNVIHAQLVADPMKECPVQIDVQAEKPLKQWPSPDFPLLYGEFEKIIAVMLKLNEAQMPDVSAMCET